MKIWLAIVVCICNVCLIDGILCQIIYCDEFCDINKYLLAVCGICQAFRPLEKNVKSLFFKKIWSKIRVWLIHECSLYTNVAYRRVNSVDLSYITHFVRSKHLIIKKVFVQEKVLAFWDQIICGHGKKKRSLVNNCTSNWHLLYNLCTNLSIKMDLILTNYVKTFPKLKLWD